MTRNGVYLGWATLAAAALVAPGVATAATVAANSDYFNGWAFATYAATADCVRLGADVVTQGTFTLGSMTYTVTPDASYNAQFYQSPPYAAAGGGATYRRCNDGDFGNNLPANVGLPADYGQRMTFLRGKYRYDFSRALPVGSVFGGIDIDGFEAARLTFRACGTNAIVDASGFTPLRVSDTPRPRPATGWAPPYQFTPNNAASGTSWLFAAYSASSAHGGGVLNGQPTPNVIADGNYSSDYENTAVIINSANVCAIELEAFYDSPSQGASSGSTRYYVATPPVPPPAPTPVPTLDIWALLGLSGLLGTGAWRIGSRRRSINCP